MKSEIYREVDWIPGFEGLVAVSNKGNVVRLKDGKVLTLKPNSNGYISVCLCKDGKKTNVRVHRLVAHAFVVNPDVTTKHDIDHIDNVRTNNDVSNLRWVTRQENLRNTSKKAGASSKYIGVCWYANGNKWRAQASVDYKVHHIGYYDNEEEAAHARDAWVRQHGGSCWKYNFPAKI